MLRGLLSIAPKATERATGSTRRARISRTFGAAAVAIGLLGLAAPHADGAPQANHVGQGTKAKGAGAPVDPPTVNSLTTMLEGLKWGMPHTDVLTAYNRIGGVFDQDYNPLLTKAQPGPQQRALEAERDTRKAAFERSWLEFKDTPTGYDATPLKGEYTYRNREALMTVERNGKKRYFFFLGQPPGERLWKVYDEVPLAEGGPLGKSFQEAVAKMQATLGATPRVRPADADQGLTHTTADWQDGLTRLRLVDRAYQKVVGVVLEERQTLNALPNLRSTKADDPLAMDPSVSAITRGGVSDPNANHPAPSASANPPKPPKKK